MQYTRLSLGAVAVATLLVLSGCSGFFAGQSTPTATATTPETTSATELPDQSTPTPTATAASTTTSDEMTATATPEPSYSYPPGASATKITDAGALLAAHNESLENGYVLEYTLDSPRTSTDFTLTTSNKTVLVEQQIDAGIVTTWSNGSDTFRHFEVTNNGSAITEHTYADRGLNASDVNRLVTFRQLVRGTAFTIKDKSVTDGDGAIYTYTATGLNNERLVENALQAQHVDDYQAEMKVTESGEIRSITVSGEIITQNGDEFDASMTYRFTKTTEVSKPSPEWLETAVEEATRMSIELKDNGRYAEIKITAGDSIPAGSYIQLWTGKGNTAFQVKSSINTGDTVYLWVTTESSRLTVQPPDESVETITFDRMTIRFLSPKRVPLATADTQDD